MIADGDVTLTESGAVVGVAVNRTYLGSKLNTQSHEGAHMETQSYLML